VDETATGLELAAILNRLGRQRWRIAGRSLRRVPQPFAPDHERAELLRRTGLRVERPGTALEVACGPELVALLADAFHRLVPLHRWLVAHV